MSTIESLFIGNTAGLSRGDKALRYFFFALLIGTVVYSIGGTFFGIDNRLRDYTLAAAVAGLASQMPGYSRAIPGAHPVLRACEWAVMGCALVCTAAVIVGDITDGGVDPEPYNTPWNVAMGAVFVALCFYTILLVSKERARRRGLLPPAR
ncbi:hypothetical protein QP500_03750 [Pauljensenia sp. UMB0018B]|uniref:Uncharacterized protein n=1 Tax=Schaalia odontolytica TaxID=1660 RepID=A0A2I1I1B4_9ACTO|nr:hypothetical protein [Schaalia odontolytica]MDK7339575.1 hypothetical protein [Pauljensenia sp. UMB0018B]PKY64924.1 hypothetical protein CYJ22_03225 [Schaalia odontolytica]